MTKLSLDVWSDIACPWCYVGKRRLESALDRFPERGTVELRWRSFELDPTAPRVLEPAVPYAERLARKYATSREQAEGMIRRMAETAAEEGLELRFDRVRPGSTFDAHRVVHLAARQGRAEAVVERLFAAYLTEGVAIGDPEALVVLAAEVGLAEDDVRAMLASDDCVRAVRADEDEAHRRNVYGVPHLVLGDGRALHGAQPPELILVALQRARDQA